MIMSMFSSFDALCAELSSYSKPNAKGTISSYSIRPVNKTREGNVEKQSTEKTSPPPPPPPTTTAKVGTSHRRKPRFAPELDGVHWFETIVPY